MSDLTVLPVAVSSGEEVAGSAGPMAPAVDAAPPAYPPASVLPTQAGPAGIRFDFNLGARVVLPNRDAGKWRVRLRDRDTGNILFESENQGAFVNSSKRFFVRFSVEIWELDATDTASLVFSHAYDARGRDILVQLPVGTLGDTMGWFPYAARFADVHGCKLTVAMSGMIIPLLRDAYPHITFVTHEEMVAQKLAETFYATYSIGLFFDDDEHIWQPTDFRMVGLHRTAGYILGVDPTEAPPRLALPDDSRPIAEPYAVIAVQSSSGCKNWNNPQGWQAVVADLKARGYRVVCIDQKPVHGRGLMWTHIPHGAEDQTGRWPSVRAG